MISQNQIQNIIHIIVEHFDPEKIILFGSYASGKPTQGSDLDLLIIKDTYIPRNKRTLAFRKYLRGLCIPIDLLVYNRKEIEKWKNVRSAFITQILKEGKLVYER